jgi:hypothetical protein
MERNLEVNGFLLTISLWLSFQVFTSFIGIRRAAKRTGSESMMVEEGVIRLVILVIEAVLCAWGWALVV